MKRIAALIYILTIICILAGCGENSSSPEFLKYCIYSPDMDVNISYICEKSWNKKIEKVEIPNALDRMTCSVYEDASDGGMHRLELGIGYEFWDEENGIGEDFTFNEIDVTWDDGTKERYDIGSITIADVDDSAFETVIQARSNLGDIMVPESGSVISLVKGPETELLDSCFRKIKLNGRDIEEYRESTVRADTNKAVDAKVLKRLNCPYDVINIYLVFEQQGETPKQFAVNINYGEN